MASATNLPPNPRLQRTRFALLRSPLSRKPLGARGLVAWWLGDGRDPRLS